VTFFVKILFFLIDTLLLNLAMLFAFYFNDSNFWINQKQDVVYFIIFSNASWLFLILVSMPYSLTKDWRLSKIIKNQLAFLLIHLLVIFSLISFLNKHYEFFQIVIFYFSFSILFFGYRVIFYYTRKLFVKETTFTNYIIVGRNDLSYQVRKFYLANPQIRHQFLGYVDFDQSKFPFEEVRKICVERDVNEIICCTSGVSNESIQQLIQFGLDSLIKVRLMFSHLDSSPQNILFDRYDNLPGVNRSGVAIDESSNQLLKRIFDLIFSSVFFATVLSWFIPIIALLIKLDSKGPVFFIQQRNGEGNKPFDCIKFRTMLVNRDADTKQATKDDSRVTKLGSFLRKSSIDELPQFINILKGDMSLIGPRPHPIKLNEKFEPLIANIMSRHYIKPGITGLAQCMGYRGETQTLADMENRVRLDRYYIENWTFWLDIKIIFLTVVSLIRGSDKAY